MPQGNMFSTSYRSAMGSNAVTDQNQGGGNKKAGFPGMIGRDSWTSIAIGSCEPVYGRCCSLKKMSTLSFTNRNVNQSLPIGRHPAGVKSSPY